MKSPRPTHSRSAATPAAKTGEAERIAKVIARAGVCSRRDAEAYIADGRVSLNGKLLTSPAVTVKEGDVILVDGQPLPKRDRTRLWLFHKPRGLVTTNFDPEGRPTVFGALPPELPRVMTVGRLDINTEGLLLLTNDGGLSRVLELPATGWLRRYRVRAHGSVDQAALDKLRDGVVIDGIMYGAIEAEIDRKQGDNMWINVGLREGKNREVKNIFGYLGMDVTRLIRVSFGPFQLGELAVGEVEEVPRRVLKDQLGDRLSAEASADFELREGERQPVQRTVGFAEQPVTSHRRDDDDAPERKGKIAHTRRPDARQTKRRHDSDLDNRSAKPAPNKARPTLGAKTERTEGRPVVLKTRPKTEEGEGPRVSRQGKSFDVARKAKTPRQEPPAPKSVKAAEKRRARDDEGRGEDRRPPTRSRTGDSRPERAPAARDGERPRSAKPAARSERGGDRPAFEKPARPRSERPDGPSRPSGGGKPARPSRPGRPDADRRR